MHQVTQRNYATSADAARATDRSPEQVHAAKVERLKRDVARTSREARDAADALLAAELETLT